MNREISKILAVILLVITSILSGQNFAFDKGFRECLEVEVVFSNDITIYILLLEYYQPIIFLLIIFYIGKLITREFISQFISFLTLGWIGYLYWRIYLLKTNLFTPDISFNHLIHTSIKFDWICFFLIIVLVIIQIISVIKYFLDWKRNVNKAEENNAE